MTKKEKLIEILNSAIKDKNEYIAVAVETRGSNDVEIIINPNSNLEKKLNYYTRSYNDDMVLNTYDGIKVVAAMAFDYDAVVERVQDQLLENRL
jgi:hypothetical protein